MNNRSFLKFLLLILVSSLLVPACSGGGKQITGEDLTAVTAYSAPAAEHIITGMANMDYETFSADFTDEMKSAIDAVKFEALVTDLNGKVGAYVSHEISKAEEIEGGLINVVYKTKFEKATINMRLVHEAAEPHLVSGLWFQ
jgi:hypothetical protein